jgi:hypothetical protein
MLLQLVDIKSANPEYKTPTKHNGEDMDILSVEASGQYVVIRYVCAEPIAGPTMEHRLVDVYCNDHGAEVFRVTAKFIPTPPPPPKFGAKLRAALQTLVS